MNRLYMLLFKNSYLPLFQRTLLYQLFEPWISPIINRFIRNPFLKQWAILVAIWTVGMLSLPSLTIAGSILHLCVTYLFPSLVIPVQMIIDGLLATIQVWGMYYICRITITKLFYWDQHKYPGWPSASIWFQMDRYLFRPEVFSMLLITLIWILLGNRLVEIAWIRTNYSWTGFDWFEFWLPWCLGCLWPVMSIFRHRQMLEV